ncbi:MAG: tRNA pseudouridine(55) synthase TruB [Acidobacteriia bacterium]|nr:tRNA pseudouridine(55) synthase TruB [Terriglobia bacterium]
MASVSSDFSGVLIIDKPAGVTSHDVVACVRKILGIRQIGHFGTLDPFATGVLPLSVGKATRFAQFYLRSRKAYEGVIRFGHATDTYDATGKPNSDYVAPRLDTEALRKAMQELTGRILQTPPPFSAKRVGGKRAYELARQQKPVDLKPVEVEIYALEMLGIEGEVMRFAVECSGGTYVRSLAHDLGQRLGCGAYLAELRRTSVAEFRLERAVTLDQLREAVQGGKVETCRVPLEALLPDCPELVVRGREEQSVIHGHPFQLAQAMRPGRGGVAGRLGAVKTLKILNAERRLIAVAGHVADAVYHPDLVLA